MTTPADWRVVVNQLKDVESVQFVERLVQFQRTFHESQLVQMDEILKQLQEQRTNLGGQKPQ